MNRYLWMFVPLCCAVTLTACGGRPDTCVVDGDCFADEKCVASKCELTAKPDARKIDAGSDDDAGSAGGGTGTDAGPTTGGGAGAGGGTGDDAGSPDCNAGESRACCSGRGEQTCDDGAWTACDATVSTESCNGIDDDCNGTVDNDVYFSMPDGGVAANVTCSIGVGACESTGSLACGTDGGVECGAQVIQPTTEICDSIDNDCDGDTDEGTKVVCLLDADNDHYAGSSVQSEFCPDTTRADFGNCPAGYVAASLGVDCNDADATKFQNLPARTDSDSDTACVGVATAVCSGAQLPTGYMNPSSCAASDDCNDTDRNIFRVASIALDADNDKHCLGNGTDTCIGTDPPATYRYSNTCTGSSDCDDAQSAYYQWLYVKSDADIDGYCRDNGNQVCSGADPRPGQRRAIDCQPTYDCDDSTNQKYRTGSFRLDYDGDTNCNDTQMYTVCYGSGTPEHYATSCPTNLDCNDFDRTLYQNVNLKTDYDGDSYCTADAAVLTCVGATLPAGTRLSSSCNTGGNDCKDNNYYATTACTKTISSNMYDKICDAGQYVTTNWNFSWNCGNGFHTTGAQLMDTNSTDGDDAFYTAESYNLAASTAHSDFTCRNAAVGHDYYSVSATCTAD